MLRKILKVLSISMVFTAIFSITVLAGTSYSDLHVPPVETKLLAPEQRYSVDTQLVLERGSIISSCTVKISNLGSGKIGILAQTLPHESIDWGYITIYLEKWLEEKQTWEVYKRYEFEFLPENEPDGELDMITISFIEDSQPADNYYRLWAYHEVEKNGVWQAKKTVTDGVFITSAP